MLKSETKKKKKKLSDERERNSSCVAPIIYKQNITWRGTCVLLQDNSSF